VMVMAPERLLDEFPPVSTADWEAAIARDLNGADYKKRLIWRGEDGLAIKPFYRAADLKNLAALDSAPGQFPFRRGTQPSGGWTIRDEIDAVNAEDANRAARAAVAAGAEGVAFTRLSLKERAELEAALAQLGEVPVHFHLASESLIRLLIERSKSWPLDAELSTGFDASMNLDFAAEIVREAPEKFVAFTIDAARFEEAGATTIEELGFGLAAGIDYLSALDERGANVNRAAAAIEFNFAIGGNYFLQIAKLRAFRMLWARAAERYGACPEKSKARIAARTSRWNKTIYDPHINILRAATEAMAAILGGAGSVSVAPFDECFKEPGEHSRRLARNTQLLLKHEASLGRVADPGGGAYYLEALTDNLAREGWKKMQEIEAQGGYRKVHAEKSIARALERSLAGREMAVARRHRVFIGTNQFVNPAEQALDRVDVGRVNRNHRGAHIYEELRLRTEWHVAETSKTPRVLLAEIGNAKMRTLRSNFALNLFASAGFSMTTRRFKSAAAIARSEADLIVLCSSDEEYVRITAKLMPELKSLGRSTPVIVAGNPKNADELLALGIAGFVDPRGNPVELLTWWQARLGVRADDAA